MSTNLNLKHFWRNLPSPHPNRPRRLRTILALTTGVGWTQGCHLKISGSKPWCVSWWTHLTTLVHFLRRNTSAALPSSSPSLQMHLLLRRLLADFNHTFHAILITSFLFTDMPAVSKFFYITHLPPVPQLEERKTFIPRKGFGLKLDFFHFEMIFNPNTSRQRHSVKLSA